MNLFKNKKAMGLPMVLGIIVFVIGTTASLLTFIIFQSNLVEIDIKQTEDYQNAVSSVNAALQIIAREQNLDPEFLDGLETYFNLSIDAQDNGVYLITSLINTNDQVISYMSGTTGSGTITDQIFGTITGDEDNFELSPLITPTSMLVAYLPDYLNQSFPWLNLDSDYQSFDQVMDFIEDLARSGSGFQEQNANYLENAWQPTAWWHTYIDDDIKIKNEKRQPAKNLTVRDGQILFINGDLELDDDGIIYGNVVVNGDVKISKGGGIVGTLYASGDVVIEKNATFGTVDRPTFVFAEGDIQIDKNATGYVYFLSDDFDGDHSSIKITGGVYAMDDADIPSRGIAENTNFNSDLLYEFAIPTIIETEDGGSGSSTTSFKYTFPKLN